MVCQTGLPVTNLQQLQFPAEHHVDKRPLSTHYHAFIPFPLPKKGKDALRCRFDAHHHQQNLPPMPNGIPDMEFAK